MPGRNHSARPVCSPLAPTPQRCSRRATAGRPGSRSWPLAWWPVCAARLLRLAVGRLIENLLSEGVALFGGAAGIFGIGPLAFGGRPLTHLQWVWLGIALCGLTHLLLPNPLPGRIRRGLPARPAD